MDDPRYFIFLKQYHYLFSHISPRSDSLDKITKTFLPSNSFKTFLSRSRRKRDLNNFIIPYTKWCGKGWTAKKYSEIGGFSKTGIFLSVFACDFIS